jgi:flagellar protein FlaG
MKIESANSTTFSVQKNSGSNAHTREDQVSRSSDVVKQKKMSQISEFEKNQMPVPEKAVIEAIEKANKAIMGANRRFEFSIHEGTKEIIVKVIDSNTDELIREIPPEKILNMVAKMWEMAGLIIDERR